MKAIIPCFLIALVALHQAFAAEQANSPLFVPGTPLIHEFVTTATGYGALAPDLSHVATYFSAADTRKIKRGALAQVKLMPGKARAVEVTGHVASILYNADPATGQSIVAVNIPRQSLPARTYASTRVELSSRSALALPTTAVIVDEGKTFVYKQAKDGDFDKTQVEVGNQQPDFTEIKSGIGPKDVVLIKGALEWARKNASGEDDE